MALRALIASDLVRSYGSRRVLDGVSLTASPGERVGLIGENGAGKSTLLRLLAGAEDADAGTVQRPDDPGYLAQELPYRPSVTVQRVVDDAVYESHEVLRGLDELGAAIAARPDDADLLARYGAVLERAQDHDAWDADRRADLVLTGLGLGEIPRDRTLAQISGGERRRLALAALLIRRPSALLLDEPTNHLDDAAAEFVEEQLRAMNGVVVLASHDRAFLDAVCGAVVDLDPGGQRFTGGYSDYLAEKQAARRRWQDAFEAQQDELDGLRRAAATTARQVAPHNRPPRDGDKFIHHFKGQNVARAVSRRVKDAERRIEVLERDRVSKPPAPFSFRGVLAPVRRTTGVVVAARDLELAGRLHLPRLDVPSGGRLLVTGSNGSGKSTLLKLVAGELTPSAGSLAVSAHRVEHLPQDVVFSRPERTAAEVYATATGSPVPLADLGLLHPREAHRPVGVLSTGQQRRLGLAVLVARRPDLLLLDEPTNHISLALADELEESLGRFPGTVLVASHDRWLRRRWEGDVLSLHGRE